MARQYKRDARGRFAAAVGSAIAKRRGKKINKLQRKNNRIVKQYSRDKSLHGTPFGNQIENRILNRDRQIHALRGKQANHQARLAGLRKRS